VNEECEIGYDLPEEKCPVCANDLIGDGVGVPIESYFGSKISN